MNRADQAELEEYIAGHVDEALEKGWIKVYFQPVVRTLTGTMITRATTVPILSARGLALFHTTITILLPAMII